ncbi:MAG: gas vesicle protein GvpG [Chloroflexi bacterium]|nr:gas vesicle protein GvpG [Chloroflexota bacterium]
MSLLLSLLTLPALGPIRGTGWLAKRIAEVAWAEMKDEGWARGELQELQMRLDLREITEGEYAEKEAALLEQIRAAREAEALPSQR